MSITITVSERTEEIIRSKADGSRKNVSDFLGEFVDLLVVPSGAAAFGVVLKNHRPIARVRRERFGLQDKLPPAPDAEAPG